MIELAWLEEARKHIGLREVKGAGTNPMISQMLDAMGGYSGESRAWWDDDETPWCGLFVGYCLGMAGRYVVREWYRAKAWGSPYLAELTKPAYGCIAVFDRKGGGHVGFVVGVDKSGNVMVLGGNQSDGVTIAPFSKSRQAKFYWPAAVGVDGNPKALIPLAERFSLPLLTSDGKVSTNEA